jgi:hypothetical protein
MVGVHTRKDLSIYKTLKGAKSAMCFELLALIERIQVGADVSLLLNPSSF